MFSKIASDGAIFKQQDTTLLPTLPLVYIFKCKSFFINQCVYFRFSEDIVRYVESKQDKNKSNTLFHIADMMLQDWP